MAGVKGKTGANRTPHYAENEGLLREGKKRCRRCNRVKPRRLFYAEARSQGGVRSDCKSCDRKFTNRQATTRRRHLRVKYDISPEEYSTLLARQGGKCRICGGGTTRRYLSVDHNHTDGEIRGLLCQRCNAILGSWKDNPETARRAAEYLENNGRWIDAPQV